MKNSVRLIGLAEFRCADLPPVFPGDAPAGILAEFPETGYEVEGNSLEPEWTVIGPTIATYVRDAGSGYRGIIRTVGKWVEGAQYFKLP